MNEREAFESWFKEKSPVGGVNAKLAARDAWLARAAVEADRAQRVPDVEDLKDRLVAISSAVADSDDREAQAIIRTTLELFASTPAPAHVASRHAMSDFEVTKSIIHGCPALRLPQSFLQRLGMTAQIVALKGATPEIAEFIAAACNKLTDHFAGTPSPAPAQQEPQKQEITTSHQHDELIQELRAEICRLSDELAYGAIQQSLATQHQEPPQQERKPMTDEERHALFAGLLSETADTPTEMFRLIVERVERHHGIRKD